MPKHHIIPRHEWRKRFDNFKGFNSPDNVVELTTEQHAEVHKLLFEINGNLFDKIAFEAISGQIGKEEAQKRAASAARLGYKASEETRLKNKLSMMGNKNAEGGKRTEEEKRLMALVRLGGHHSGGPKISAANRGRKISPEGRANMSRAQMGNKGATGHVQSKEHIQRRVASRLANKLKKQTSNLEGFFS